MPPFRRRIKKRSTAARVPAEFRQASRGPRLQKVLAEAGVASRRDCEAMIENGRVTVNGQPVAGLPAWVDPATDVIEVDGKRLRPAAAGRHGHAPGRPPRAAAGSRSTSAPFASGGGDRIYIMLHKPRRTLSTTDDPDRRRHVLDMVPGRQLPGAPRLYPVGRLDADSTGLILLTNDGELAHRLTHPSYGVSKTYRVSVRGRVETEHLEELQHGLYLAQRAEQPDDGPRSRPGSRQGPPFRPRPRQFTTSGRATSAPGQSRSAPPALTRVKMDHVRIVHHLHDRARGDRTILEVTLHSGHNRVIRRMLAHVGLKVRRLQRTAIGPLHLGKLPIGHFRPLTPMEITSLWRAVQPPVRISGK